MKKIMKCCFVNLIWGIFSALIGWYIGFFMNKPDISYYTVPNLYSVVTKQNNQQVLISRKYPRFKPTLYSSKLYIQNNGYTAYEGKDFSSKNPLRVESDIPIKLFSIDTTQSEDSMVSVQDKDGTYFIQFDYLNLKKSIKLVFVHEKPVNYIKVNGSGKNLPVIKENLPWILWIFKHFYLLFGILGGITIILFVVFYHLDQPYRNFQKQYMSLKAQIFQTKDVKKQLVLLDQIEQLIDSYAKK